MIKLVVHNFNGNSELEQLLAKSNIEYQICFNGVDYGISPPYLVVDGVPLDEKRSIKWVKSHLID